MPAIAWLILIPAAIIGLFPATLRADVAGVASVIDGDTIVVHGQRMSPVGGRPDVARRWSELLLLATSGSARCRRRKPSTAWSLCHVPIGRGCRAKKLVPENSPPHRWAAAGPFAAMTAAHPVVSRPPDRTGPNSRSDAHCAIIVSDWEEPSGESRFKPFLLSFFII